MQCCYAVEESCGNWEDLVKFFWPRNNAPEPEVFLVAGSNFERRLS